MITHQSSLPSQGTYHWTAGFNKYLGVCILCVQFFLSWKSHIDQNCKKVNSSIGFLRCNLMAYFCMFYIAVLYGTYITKTRSGRLRWYNEELLAIRPTAIEIQTAYHPFTITRRRPKIQLILLYKVVQYLVDIPAT